jgi:hypothetical protein
LHGLIQLEAAFWRYVETDTPPPADGSESAELALRCLYPQDKGIAVDFSSDRNLSATFADWLSVRQTLAETEKLEAKLKQSLQQAMGEASRAIFETGEVTWKKAKDSVVLDTARLLADQPDIAQDLRNAAPRITPICSRLIHSRSNQRSNTQSINSSSATGYASGAGGEFFYLRGTIMLKGLVITPPVLGRISIGKVVEKAGKRLPEKDDQFTITSQVQGADGWLPHPFDEGFRKAQGGKIRSIPIGCCSMIPI